jgi:hypothetical protein
MIDVIAYIRMLAPFLAVSQTLPIASDAPVTDEHRES